MQKKEAKKFQNKNLINILIGAGVAIAVIMVIFAVMAGVIASGKIKSDTTWEIILLAAVCGGLAGGFVASKKNRSRALLTGCAAGLVAFIPTLIGRAFFSEDSLFGGLFLWLLMAFLVSGAIGGMAGAKKRKKRR